MTTMMETVGNKTYGKMKTKAAFVWMVLALTTIPACQKEQVSDKGNFIETAQEEEQAAPMEMTFSADTDKDAVDDGVAGLKTTLGDGASIVWSNSDDIKVFSGGSGSTFTVSSISREGKTAQFSGLAKKSDTYYAFYPDQSLSNIEDGVITAILPEDQTAVAGSFGNKANLAIAKTGNHYLYFRNVGALLRLTLQADGIKQIRLESLGGEPLSGQAQIDWNDGNPSVKMLNPSPSVTLNGNFENGKTYYFVIFPGTFASGLKMTFFKDGYKATLNNSKVLTIARNGNKSIGTIKESQLSAKWVANDSFTPGTKVYIAGEGTEAGQQLTYTAASGYLDYTQDNSGDIDAFSGQTYNYEIFTRIQGGQTFWLRSEDGRYFSLNADGNTVSEITSPENAAGSVPGTGIYRIRVNLPSGNAYVSEVTHLQYYHCWAPANRFYLDYAGKGVWVKKNMSIIRQCGPGSSSYDNRYKFELTIGGNSQQYGTRYATDSSPAAGSPATYWYLQPCKSTQWNSKFKFPNWLVDDSNDGRYVADLYVYLNEDKGHYTHAFINERDNQSLPDLTAGEEVFVGGGEEAGQAMAYVGADGWYNTDGFTGSNDYVGDTSGLDPNTYDTYDYEVFTKLNEGEKLWFYTESGKHFAPNSSGTALDKIAAPASAVWTAPATGVWRIRANFAKGESRYQCSIRRIGEVRAVINFYHSTGYTLSYTGKGKWKSESQPIFWKEGVDWDKCLHRYKFKFTFDKKEDGTDINYTQYYGTLYKHGADPATDENMNYWYLQPFQTEGWHQVFYYPSWLYDSNNNGRYHATVTLYMNADKGHYTHTFTEVIDTQSLPEIEAGDEVFIGGSEEDGQAMCYIPAGYWGNTEDTGVGDKGVLATEATDYNYEIFTRINAGTPFWFHSASGAKYALNAEGDAMVQIASTAAASYTVSENGVYRIRTNFKSGSVSIHRIDNVQLRIAELGILGMSYDKAGRWYLDNCPILWLKRSWAEYETRHKFIVHFADIDVSQEYGTLRPAATESDSDFYDVRPYNTDNQWVGCVTWPNSLIDHHYSPRYLGTVNLQLNQENGQHYRHSITQTRVFDFAGTVSSLTLSGSAESAVMDGYLARDASAMTAGSFESFRHFNAGDFYIQDNNGHYHVLNKDGSTAIVYSGYQTCARNNISNDNAGEYDLMITPGSNTYSMRRIHRVILYWHPWRISNKTEEMSYEGDGVWKTDTFTWSAEMFDGSTAQYDTRYHFRMFYNEGGTEGDHWGGIGGGDMTSNFMYAYRYNWNINEWSHTWKTSPDGGSSIDERAFEGKNTVFRLRLNTTNANGHYDNTITEIAE